MVREVSPNREQETSELRAEGRRSEPSWAERMAWPMPLREGGAWGVWGNSWRGLSEGRGGGGELRAARFGGRPCGACGGHGRRALSRAVCTAVSLWLLCGGQAVGPRAGGGRPARGRLQLTRQEIMRRVEIREVVAGSGFSLSIGPTGFTMGRRAANYCRVTHQLRM